MKKILFLAIGGVERASSRFRVWEFLPFFDRAGIEYRTFTFFEPAKNPPGNLFLALLSRLRREHEREKQLRRDILWCDTLMIQEALLSPGLLRFAVRHHKRIVYDFSDPVHLLWKDKNHSLLKRIFYGCVYRRSFNAALRCAGHVFIENESLRSTAGAYGAEVHLMRGPINIKKFIPRSDVGNANRKFTVGWTGSPGTLPLIRPLFPVIEQAARRIPLRLFLVGSGLKELKLKNVDAVLSDWSLEKEAENVAGFDCGLFYLTDNEISRARGGGKLFVYLASGVPFIAPDRGIAGQVFRESGCGILENDLAKWGDILADLAASPEKVAVMRSKAREKACELYSHRACFPPLLEVLTGESPGK